jgi:hypothetical protein
VPFFFLSLYLLICAGLFGYPAWLFYRGIMYGEIPVRRISIFPFKSMLPAEKIVRKDRTPIEFYAAMARTLIYLCSVAGMAIFGICSFLRF